jgi:hypothetical protein
MTTAHLLEQEIQQYAINDADYPAFVAEHLKSCGVCRAEVENYRSLFSEIQQLPVPVFNFDLPAAVLARLPQNRSRLSTDDFIAGFLVIFAVGCICLLLYYFRKSMANILAEVPPFFIYAIAISTSFLLLIKMFSLYKKYLSQVRLLNFR